MVMDVPEGYKQTEVNIIPEDWEAVPLHPYIKITSGESPSKFYFKNQGYPYFKVEQLGQSYKYLTETPYLFESSQTVKAGSVLFAKRGASILLNNIRLLKNDGFMDTNVMALTITNEDELVNEYLYYQLSYIGLAQLADTTSIPQINNKHIYPIRFLKPIKKEQIAIATTLSEVDALITSLTTLIEKKRQIKTATMQRLLTGKQRLLGFGEEWKDKKFCDVVYGFSSGATPLRKRADYYKGKIKWVSSGELNYNCIVDTDEKISVEAVKVANLSLHPIGTFLMAITGLEAEGTRGSCAILGVEATTNQSCMALYPKNGFSIDYMYHYYCYFGEKLALEFCQGTKQQSYTAAIVKILPIFIPPSKKEQESIANVLSDMDNDITTLETRLAKTKALKQGMMQELLTGRTRLV